MSENLTQNDEVANQQVIEKDSIFLLSNIHDIMFLKI
jgi:hypothetical protein